MFDDIYALSDDQILEKIGERVRMARLKQNITQESLAENAQISLSALKRIEKGEIGSLESLIRVLRILNLLDDLLGLVQQPSISPNEYYAMVHNQRKPLRQRARKKLSQSKNTESEW